jgi:HEAT repeat protein
MRDAEGLKDATSAFAGLRDVSQESTLAHLEHALADGDVELRLDAIKALVVSRDARAVPSLKAVAMHDPDAKVRAVAEQGLRTIGEPR